ncbi:hypothetical protein GUJ93_ZPchr0458g22814 [Zizania palustris]|uniref:Uncharacterized protein n=1 Tax=Zizania palustris TaxID=103762 RepID=A0A8J5QVI7_ZIZPA|nr:hypothetical protein GUJ93_ZPchr0458g22814 [Zizania palustris]
MYGARQETCSIFDQIVSPQWRPVACELSKRAWNLRVIRVSLLASAAFLQEPQTWLLQACTEKKWTALQNRMFHWSCIKESSEPKTSFRFRGKRKEHLTFGTHLWWRFNCSKRKANGN